MVHLSNDDFVRQLQGLFDKAKNNGSVFVNMKRVDLNARIKKKNSKNPEEPINEVQPDLVCLVRATLDKKTIRTEIKPDGLDKFLVQYQSVMRSSMTKLKRKVRNKKDKEKDKTTSNAMN